MSNLKPVTAFDGYVRFKVFGHRKWSDWHKLTLSTFERYSTCKLDAIEIRELVSKEEYENMVKELK